MNRTANTFSGTVTHNLKCTHIPSLPLQPSSSLFPMDARAPRFLIKWIDTDSLRWIENSFVPNRQTKQTTMCWLILFPVRWLYWIVTTSYCFPGQTVFRALLTINYRLCQSTRKKSGQFLFSFSYMVFCIKNDDYKTGFILCNASYQW